MNNASISNKPNHDKTMSSPASNSRPQDHRQAEARPVLSPNHEPGTLCQTWGAYPEQCFIHELAGPPSYAILVILVADAGHICVVGKAPLILCLSVRQGCKGLIGPCSAIPQEGFGHKLQARLPPGLQRASKWISANQMNYWPRASICWKYGRGVAISHAWPLVWQEPAFQVHSLKCIHVLPSPDLKTTCREQGPKERMWVSKEASRDVLKWSVWRDAIKGTSDQQSERTLRGSCTKAAESTPSVSANSPQTGSFSLSVAPSTLQSAVTSYPPCPCSPGKTHHMIFLA